ncbi:DUF1572 domain-containing protein [Occallatibacter riparius]|uniref:DUF1572 domain-containing protein n=1 Tax=Occallatibacter riparius TaxID=1002689 RepID=A0A9J7BQ73_9BACT|nr:DUF1572 domain-containing protein [Occallatibacter riparius]UWZ85028.1 DUF1572 domain-containing protein [Occallatibacter riparius]
MQNGMVTTFVRATREMLLEQSWPRLRTCVESLTDEQIWWRPNSSSNSIGNLVLHLNGNVTQWIIGSFAHADDRRDRPAEFSRTEGIGREELVKTLATTMERVAAVLNDLTEDDLLKRYDIQGYNTTGLEAIYHVTEHFALHYGQIAYITKMLSDRDLGFYRELNKTGRIEHSGPARP